MPTDALVEEPIGKERWVLFSQPECDHGVCMFADCRDCIWLESYPSHLEELHASL